MPSTWWRRASPLPWLHIVDEVALVAKSRGFRKLAVTGTKYTMEGTVYQTKLPAAGLSMSCRMRPLAPKSIASSWTSL